MKGSAMELARYMVDAVVWKAELPGGGPGPRGLQEPAVRTPATLDRRLTTCLVCGPHAEPLDWDQLQQTRDMRRSPLHDNDCPWTFPQESVDLVDPCRSHESDARQVHSDMALARSCSALKGSPQHTGCRKVDLPCEAHAGATDLHLKVIPLAHSAPRR
jgi:hypothetical protein